MQCKVSVKIYNNLYKLLQETRILNFKNDHVLYNVCTRVHYTKQDCRAPRADVHCTSVNTASLLVNYHVSRNATFHECNIPLCDLVVLNRRETFHGCAWCVRHDTWPVVKTFTDREIARSYEKLTYISRISVKCVTSLEPCDTFNATFHAEFGFHEKLAKLHEIARWWKSWFSVKCDYFREM